MRVMSSGIIGPGTPARAVSVLEPRDPDRVDAADRLRPVVSPTQLPRFAFCVRQVPIRNKLLRVYFKHDKVS